MAGGSERREDYREDEVMRVLTDRLRRHDKGVLLSEARKVRHEHVARQ